MLPDTDKASELTHPQSRYNSCPQNQLIVDKGMPLTAIRTLLLCAQTNTFNSTIYFSLHLYQVSHSGTSIIGSPSVAALSL